MDIPREDRGFYASPQQREVLLRLITHPEIEHSYFLTGGTALAVFYIQHRVSDDLDLFTLGPARLSELDFWIRAQWTDSCAKIKEGLSFIQEKPSLLPEIRREFGYSEFLDYFARLSVWLYQKYNPEAKIE